MISSGGAACCDLAHQDLTNFRDGVMVTDEAGVFRVQKSSTLLQEAIAASVPGRTQAPRKIGSEAGVREQILSALRFEWT